MHFWTAILTLCSIQSASALLCYKAAEIASLQNSSVLSSGPLDYLGNAFTLCFSITYCFNGTSELVPISTSCSNPRGLVNILYGSSNQTCSQSKSYLVSQLNITDLSLQTYGCCKTDLCNTPSLNTDTTGSETSRSIKNSVSFVSLVLGVAFLVAL